MCVDSYLKNGDIMTPDPFFCDMTKFFIEHAIKLLLDLQDWDPKSIHYLSQFCQIL